MWRASRSAASFHSARSNGAPFAAIGVQLSPDRQCAADRHRRAPKDGRAVQILPAGREAYTIPYDTSLFVKISIEEVVKTLLEAVVLVFLVMYLFLQNIRYTLIPTIVVPVALMGTFAAMQPSASRSTC
jgi:multidrug efflux pump